LRKHNAEHRGWGYHSPSSTACLDKMISKEDLAAEVTSIQNQFKMGMDHPLAKDTDS